MHIDLHPNAKADLLKIKDSDRRAVSAVLVALEQIEADPNFGEKLMRHNDNSHLGTVRLGVRRWQSAKDFGSLWRFRIFDTPATSYRVVYGYHFQTDQICILAVVHKEEFNYELDSDLARRILADWSAL